MVKLTQGTKAVVEVGDEEVTFTLREPSPQEINDFLSKRCGRLVSSRVEFFDLLLISVENLENTDGTPITTEQKALIPATWKNDIIFWGFASYTELRNLYRSASVFVFPSFYEGFGFPPLEAQASGTPVVASSRGALAEVLGNSALVADPVNPESIAVQVESLFNNQGLRERITAKGSANARRFRWEKTAEATLSVLTNGE